MNKEGTGGWCGEWFVEVYILVVVKDVFLGGLR